MGERQETERERRNRAYAQMHGTTAPEAPAREASDTPAPAREGDGLPEDVRRTAVQAGYDADVDGSMVTCRRAAEAGAEVAWRAALAAASQGEGGLAEDPNGEEYGWPGDGLVEPGISDDLLAKLHGVATGRASGQTLWREEAQAIVATLAAPPAVQGGGGRERAVRVAADAIAEAANAETEGDYVGSDFVAHARDVVDAVAESLAVPAGPGGGLDREALAPGDDVMVRARVVRHAAGDVFVVEVEDEDGPERLWVRAAALAPLLTGGGRDGD